MIKICDILDSWKFKKSNFNNEGIYYSSFYSENIYGILWGIDKEYP